MAALWRSPIYKFRKPSGGEVIIDVTTSISPGLPPSKVGFSRPVSQSALAEARNYPNFTALVWPHDFLSNSVRFDAALLCYVLQTMPVPAERERVLKALKKKLKAESYLLYMSRYNQGAASISRKQRVSDGYFMWPKRGQHSFYREFATNETHELLGRFGFRYLKSLSLNVEQIRCSSMDAGLRRGYE